VRSLFLRIFLWFWAAMAVVVAVLVVSSPFFTRSHPGVERWQRDAGQFLSERVTRIAEGIAVGERGESRLDRPRRRHRMPLHLYVFDPDGVEVQGRAAGEDARKLALRAAESGEELSERFGSRHLMARPVTDPDGHLRVVVGALQRPPRPIDLLDPHILLPRLAALTLVVGLFCLLLARHLSSPVASLRAATRKLADGDLSARVGSPVSRRRDEIGELARDFDGMAERLETLVGSQRRLLRDVSHELRSPLARLEVALELARQRTGDDATDPLDRIGRESQRLDSLVEQLLSLERLESGSGTTERHVIDLAALVEEVVADAPAELMHSAIENVVRNATAHTPAGSAVEVTLDEQVVHGGPVARIQVRDHGPGVPEDELHRLFEPFYRVEDARDRKTGGAGLGLAITRRAVGIHGGEVEGRNHPDGGLEITIHLPMTER